MKYDTRRLVLLAILLAVSIVLNIVERLVLMGFTGLPMVRLGLANVVVLIVLYVLSPKDAFIVLVLRILLVSLLAPGSTVITFLLALAGGLAAFTAMYACKRTGRFTIISVSVAGAFFHAVGQILMAMFVLATEEIVFILPLFLALSIPTGILTGLIAKKTAAIIKGQLRSYRYEE